MKCSICGEKVTKSQLKHAEAIETNGEYTHTDCIDDLARPAEDAHHRE